MRLELKACNYPTKALRRIRLFQQRENAGKHTNREHDGDATSWDGQLSRGSLTRQGSRRSWLVRSLHRRRSSAPDWILLLMLHRVKKLKVCCQLRRTSLINPRNDSRP
jgi:hypothetical protein